MFYSYVFAMLVGWCGNEPRPFPWPKTHLSHQYLTLTHVPSAENLVQSSVV